MVRPAALLALVLLVPLVGTGARAARAAAAGREASGVPARASDSRPAFDEEFGVTMAQYNSVAYCWDNRMVESWTCPVCHGRVGDFEVNKVFAEFELNIQGFTGYSPRLDAFLVVFRGTDSGDLRNWITDLSFLELDLELPYPGSKGAKVHGGFLRAYNSTNVRPMIVVSRFPGSHRFVWRNASTDAFTNANTNAPQHLTRRRTLSSLPRFRSVALPSSAVYTHPPLSLLSALPNPTALAGEPAAAVRRRKTRDYQRSLPRRRPCDVLRFGHQVQVGGHARDALFVGKPACWQRHLLPLL